MAYFKVSRDSYWPLQYQFVRKYIRACEKGQTIKPSPFIPCFLTASTCPKIVLAVRFYGLRLPFSRRRLQENGILVFVDLFSKMLHLAAVPEPITAQGCALVFTETTYRLHGLPRELVCNRGPRFTAEFWQFVITIAWNAFEDVNTWPSRNRFL